MTYEYICWHCSEEFEVFNVKVEDRIAPKKCPFCGNLDQVEVCVSVPRLSSPGGLGLERPDTSFDKYVLGRIKHSVPGAKNMDAKRPLAREF